MIRHAFFVAAAIVSLAAIGCGPGAHYTVEQVHSESARGRVDGQWFTRTIVVTGTGRKAVELVYCPMVAGAPTVCRTAIVWEDDHSELLQKAP